jgi:hypothetical protein
MAPTMTQEQQTSSSTKSQVSHDHNENGETSHELAAKNLDGDLREENNHDMQKDTEQGAQTPEQEPAVGSATEVHKKKVAVAPVSPLTVNTVVVPAAVDPMQAQVLAALQALQVIELGVEPGAICTRRDYARWLIAVSSTLARYWNSRQICSLNLFIVLTKARFQCPCSNRHESLAAALV